MLTNFHRTDTCDTDSSISSSTSLAFYVTSALASAKFFLADKGWKRRAQLCCVTREVKPVMAM